jgi:RNA polymerase sigma factor (sigma-70 family)
MGQTDEYLVAQVRAGDDAAFEAIYDRYAAGMLAFCMHMLGSREAAEDALQLTFVSAYRALRGGDSNISLRPWLYTIARNRCLSELRTRRDTVDVDVDVATADRPFFDGLADQVQRRDELREMLADIQRLPADQRAALVLFELGDHSHHEIAAVLDVRREKVKALIFQAREALVRGRQARGRPCAEIRERLATLHGRVLSRSMTRAHIDRCPSCAAFEAEVRRQRGALALILPVTLTGELKALVLGSALGGGRAVAAGAGACGSGAVVSGGATAAGSACGGGAVTAGTGTAGSLAAAGTGTGAASSLAAAGTGAASTAVVAGAPGAAIATGLSTVGAECAAAGAGGLGASGVVAKILTVAAIATGAVGASHASSHQPRPILGPATGLQIPIASASSAETLTTASSGPSTPGAATTPAATPSSANSTTPTPAATPSSANSTTPTPAATPSSANSTTPTTPAPSGRGTTTPPTTATTPAPSGPGTATPPTTATTDLVPDRTGAPSAVDAVAPTAATGG